MKNRNFKIEPSQSKISWKGRKITAAHNGTIDIKEGHLTFNGGKLIGGVIVIDTTSIKVLDVTDPVPNAQFVGHLLSDDFFAAEQNPEASFVVTAAEQTGIISHSVKGDLTIKGITHSIAFNPKIYAGDKGLKACGIITIDRTWYEMKFQSGNFFKGLKNRMINDDFEFEVNITAKEVFEPEYASLAFS